MLEEVSETQSNGRVFKKQIRGEYNWLTFAQVDTRARNLGNGLTALGQRRKENIVIFAETRAEWMIALQSCFANSFPGEHVLINKFNQSIKQSINKSTNQ